MKAILAAALLLAASAPAFAEETILELDTSIGSYHFNRDKKRCEINPGLGVAIGTQSLRWGVGGYHNSDCHQSWYAGGARTWAIGNGWRAGGGGGFFFGYQEEKKQANGERRLEDRILFAPFGLLTWEEKRYGFDIGYIPPRGNLVFFRVKILQRVQR